jgi:hypothetical protein
MLAAAASIVLVAGVWVGSRGGGASAEDPAALVALAPRAATGGQAAVEPFGWPVTRGAGTGAPADARAIRYGADAAELEIAVAAGDTAAVRQLAGGIVALLDDVPGSAPIAGIYRGAESRAASAEGKDLRRDAWGAARALLGEEAWLGSWLAAARRAAATGNVAFFRTDAANRAAAALRGTADLPAALRPLPDLILRAGREGNTAEWVRLRADLEAALRALGS